MESTLFTATLLRASANGFAAMAVSRVVERDEDEALDGGFEAWQAQLRSLVLELAAAVEDGGERHFAARVAWARDAFAARGLESAGLRATLDELASVLKESLSDEAWTPLPAFFAAARRELERASTADTTQRRHEDPLGALADAYRAHLQAGEGARAIDSIVGAVRGGRLSVDDALNGVLTRAMHDVGQLWHSGVLNVAEEHFATYTSGRLVEQLVLMAPEPRTNGRTVLLTMVEGDAHELGLRIVAALFELDGWRTLCLGANTPIADLALAAERFDADLVVLGATLNTQRAAVSRALDELRRARPHQIVVVGGPAFQGLAGRAQSIGANGCALEPREALRLGRELCGA